MDRILEGSDLCGYLTQAVDVILCLDISVLQVSKSSYPRIIQGVFKRSKILFKNYSLRGVPRPPLGQFIDYINSIGNLFTDDF